MELGRDIDHATLPKAHYCFSYFGQSDLGMYAHFTKKGLCVIKREFALDSFML